ncbi:MAG: hypothetical protein COY53_06330 [Elusimicrobia bacterium CG_4_10_14_0_8_um_filter_37_32]|nr:MAG: hypothetical protein COS17_09270 [Elusimicrobia bacterium CG02_land_8_20_14_3_00_37_13]PIZ13125.1 MAG: hypothetical protein COY53_06330 [Elusimicrobia bacterium CG_4_10_14_0_8_um_filter_37_32]
MIAESILGEIVSVDVTAKTVTIKALKSGNIETYNTDARVMIKKLGKTITLTDLTAGNRVTMYRYFLDKKIVTSIYVM